MGNYRGITITAAIGKTFEYCLLDKLNLKSNSPLQFGFTSSLFPIMAGLLISEALYEKKLDKENFYITCLDVKSAFDVVRHEILLDKLLDQNLNPIYWKILREVYSDLSLNVKWLDGLSQPFSIKQGVRQGEILSTRLYKICVQDLLEELEQNAIGYHLGNIYVGSPACADDIAFISSDKYEMQTMLNIVSRYAKEHHYLIHPVKTQLVDCSKTPSNYDWVMNDNKLKITNIWG